MERETWQNHLDQGQEFIIFSNGCLDLSHWSHGPCMKCSKVSGTSNPKGLCFFSNSAVKVHDSQVYRNMKMTRERINFTFDSKDTLLSLQMDFNFVRAAVACAILERINDLNLSSETTAPRYLKFVTVHNFCLFTFISL